MRCERRDRDEVNVSRLCVTAGPVRVRGQESEVTAFTAHAGPSLGLGLLPGTPAVPRVRSQQDTWTQSEALSTTRATGTFQFLNQHMHFLLKPLRDHYCHLQEETHKCKAL